MKTKFACVVAVCTALFASGCGSGPQNLIVGKWEAGQPGAKLTAEFGRDGNAQLTMMGHTFRGTYKVNGDDELEWTLNGTTTKFKMKVTATELEVTSEGKTVTYKRV
jgi:hypothetical protein